MDNLTELYLLFTSSFVAATLFPAGSEILITSLHLAQNHHVATLVIIATIGNVLGSVINYLMGYYLIRFQNKKWFFFKKKAIERSTKLFQKYGKFSLLFAWLPIIGDPITLIAGIFRINIFTFLILVTIGKITRYVIIVSIF